MEINYEIRNSTKAKRVSIMVYSDARVVVTKPTHIPQFVAEAFARRKISWIAKKIQQIKNKTPLPFSNLDKKEALTIVKERIDLYNVHYQFQFNKISIKSHKNLWGSCSAKKNLNFNHKIVSFTQPQMDYIIVHELCHLKELNHSKRFWDLVEETIPNHKVIRKQLREYAFQ